ncbi:hypothetical protein EYC84_009650 [Monilinia fructicola]|uniref:non-specific serine/threonine protein kinase n=1 Tax=Monilinia fructicola TaxID=38448 RepID=A0A5M9JB56_MONFR|nr:hypothetical protein EYC84_009650 [Monilinia fructicola]
MTQLFHSSSPNSLAANNEKRNLSGSSMSSNKHSNGHSPFPQKLKNFFRINSSANHGEKSEKNDPSLKSESKSSFRQSKFFPGGGRNRSTTIASEGNALDDGMSPTAHANPYFAHQGPPALRHHDDASIPPSPPIPQVSKSIRVASAPNAQGLFSSKGDADRPATAELGKEPLVHNASTTMLSMVDGDDGNDALGAAVEDDLAPLQPPNLRNNPAFRRTFDKIKLIGKGDVGKVYLVREKKSSRLYAMKVLSKQEMIKRNKIKEALAEQEILATSNHPFIVTFISLLSIRRPSILMYGILQWWGILSSSTNSTRKMYIPEDDARFYAAEVTAALEYLHLMGFIYRDLKPENILLHQSGHIMLSDFDLSKQSAPGGKPTMILGRNERILSSGLKSILRPKSLRVADTQVQLIVWTLGILIYEMLFGTTPFKGKNRNATFANILRDDVPFPEHSAPQISNLCKSVIRKLLIKDENRRLGARAGASDVKTHPFFRTTQWALIRHMKPPMIPHQGRGVDTVNFRNVKEIKASRSIRVWQHQVLNLRLIHLKNSTVLHCTTMGMTNINTWINIMEDMTVGDCKVGNCFTGEEYLPSSYMMEVSAIIWILDGEIDLSRAYFHIPFEKLGDFNTLFAFELR